MPAKAIHFLMTHDDEARFSSRLREAIPTIQFFGEDESSAPVTLERIDSSRRGSIWICETRGSVPSWKDLPPAIHFHGSYRRDSPLESLRGATLIAGDMTISFDRGDEDTSRFASRVWRVLRGMTTNKVQRINPASSAESYGEVRSVYVAAGAVEWQRNGGLLASASANMYFRVYGKVPAVEKLDP